MKVFEYLDRISMMHKLIKVRKTGPPEEFARRLGVSRTSLYELIDEMRIRGAPIKYSKSAGTFYYREPFEILVNCSLRPLNVQEQEKTGGGCFPGKILFFRMLSSEIGFSVFGAKAPGLLNGVI